MLPYISRKKVFFLLLFFSCLSSRIHAMNFSCTFSTKTAHVDFWVTSAPAAGCRLPNNVNPWTERCENVTEDGCMSHILGSNNPMPGAFFKGNAGPRYLEIRAEGEGTSPYKELVSVPYELQSIYEQEAENSKIGSIEELILTSNKPIRSTAGQIVFGGDTRILGNLRIGEHSISIGTGTTPGYNEIRCVDESGSYITAEDQTLVIRTTGTASARDLTLQTDNGDILLMPESYVGIGTASPGAKLTVNGAFLRYGSTIYGTTYSNTHVNLGYGSTTGANGQDFSYCTVGGGNGNIASYSYATVSGGRYNEAANPDATVSGGYNNIIGYHSGDFGTISGGDANRIAGNANADYSSIGGGIGNVIDGGYSTISGGWGNIIYNNASASTISGGSANYITGSYATIPGGYDNDADGDYSFAAGRRANADNQGSFALADSQDADFTV
ncbi:MAG: hypothetical protein JW871_05040, partial [Endomicrobiales bacterium]|nr:hypothetical protein [Endomicrobiales bacterium]